MRCRPDVDILTPCCRHDVVVLASAQAQDLAMMGAAKPKRRSVMPVDGEKLRNLRFQKGMSQEKLGLMAKLNKRTIQRAENGADVAIETLAFIAEALEVEPASLRSNQLEFFDHGARLKATKQGEVVLVPVARGSRLVNMLRAAFMATFEYEAEATERNPNLLQELAEVLNRAWENPWLLSWRDNPMTDAELLLLQAKANRLLPALEELGIRVFVGTYKSWQQRPLYDVDEGQMYVTDRTPRVQVTNVRVVVSDEAETHLTRIPSDHEDFSILRRAD